MLEQGPLRGSLLTTCKTKAPLVSCDFAPNRPNAQTPSTLPTPRRIVLFNDDICELLRAAIRDIVAGRTVSDRVLNQLANAIENQQVRRTSSGCATTLLARLAEPCQTCHATCLRLASEKLGRYTCGVTHFTLTCSLCTEGRTRLGRFIRFGALTNPRRSSQLSSLLLQISRRLLSAASLLRRS